MSDDRGSVVPHGGAGAADPAAAAPASAEHVAPASPDPAPAPSRSPEPGAPAPRLPVPAVEEPSADVVRPDAESALPGAHRGGFFRLPTAPVAITIERAPALPGEEGLASERWDMAQPPPRRGLGAWALGFSIVGLVFSLFVGWGFPIGVVGVVAAILALRRPLESRAVAVWALVLGAASILYSAAWLLTPRPRRPSSAEPLRAVPGPRLSPVCRSRRRMPLLKPH